VHGFEFFDVATHQHDLGAAARTLECECFAEAGSGSGDRNHAAGEFVFPKDYAARIKRRSQRGVGQGLSLRHSHLKTLLLARVES